jgi:hypothetical protein
MNLPSEVIAEDRRLEKGVASSSEALMRHRWHWTLDESNAARVSMSEYATAIGRTRQTVSQYANGWAIKSRRNLPASEALQQATMGEETAAAAHAVANARGLTTTSARQSRPVEIRRVREMARERAENRGTTIEEETAKAADWIVKSEQVTEKAKDERKQRLGLRFIELEEVLQRMRREGVKAVNLASEIEWGDEERELLSATLVNVKALIELTNLALVGAADVDWDSELASLEGGR